MDNKTADRPGRLDARSGHKPCLQERACALARPPNGEASDVHAAPSSSGGSTFRVLIVEDDATTQLLLRALLDAHCDLTIVPTAAQALETIRRRRHANARNDARSAVHRPFDAIAVDIRLAGPRSGPDFLAELRGMKVLANTPLLALTAHALPDDRKTLLGRQFGAYMGKPFTPSELFSLILQMTD